MGDTVSLLEKELAKAPIHVPGSPFWEVFKRFGRDEAIAMAINVAGTAGLEQAVNRELITLSTQSKDIALAVAGPIVEKFGFFPAHFKEAWDVYKTTPVKEREDLSHYFGSAVKGGSVSLAEDVLVHDPLYIGMMYIGLQLYPETPAWLIATTSFIAAVFGVAGLEVGVTEARYKLLKRRFKNLGFGNERYLESRFFVSAERHPEELLNLMSREFNLPDRAVGEYHDRYHDTTLKHYSGRVPKLRLRNRKIKEEDREVNSAQIVYTRTSEIACGEASQFRYFPQKKDKFYFPLGDDMPSCIEEIDDERVRNYLTKIAEGPSGDVSFERSIARNETGLFVSTDRVSLKNHRPFYVFELKTRNDADLLKEGMRYVMREFPVLQITHSKGDIVRMNGKNS